MRVFNVGTCVYIEWVLNIPYIVGIHSLVGLWHSLVLPQLLQELRLCPVGVGQRGGHSRGRRHQLRTQALVDHRGLCITADEKNMFD